MTGAPDIPLTASKGDILFSPGAPCAGFVLLDSGTIRVSLTARNGREVVLYRVSPGDICLQTFSCLIENRTYSAEGIAETDLTGRIVPADAFRARLGQDPAFRDSVFSSVAHRFSDFEQLVEDVALTGFDARLARTLLRLVGPDGTLSATHDQLAAETASGRAFVSRRLAEFSRRGLVDPGRGTLRVTDMDGLRRVAADDR